MISDYQGGTLLNRRGEWGQNLPPKLEIVVDDKIQPTKNRKSMPKRKKQMPEMPAPDTSSPDETTDTASTRNTKRARKSSISKESNSQEREPRSRLYCPYNL